MSDSPPTKKKCTAGQSGDILVGTVRLRVDKVSELGANDEVISPTETIGGFPWQITVFKTARRVEKSVQGLRFELHCDMNELSNVWYCEASANLIVINQDNPDNSITERIKKGRFDWGKSFSITDFHDINGWAAIADPSKGFYKEDSIIVEAHITVKSSGKSFRTRAESSYDFSSPSETSDVILVVEGEEFHVSRQLLAIHSTYFKTLFYKDFKEMKEDKIVLQDVKAKQFRNVLRFVYPTTEKLDDLGFPVIADIVKYSDAWDMKVILDGVEKYLLEKVVEALLYPGAPCVNARVFLLADSHRLHTLYDACLSRFKTCKNIEDFRATEEYPKCSAALKEDLFTLHIKLSKMQARPIPPGIPMIIRGGPHRLIHSRNPT